MGRENCCREGNKDPLLYSGPYASFDAWVKAKLAELLLRKNNMDEAMEWLGKAMATLQAEQNGIGGSALATTRVLGLIARGCHAIGQAVTSEGLYVTVIVSFKRKADLSSIDRVDTARALHAYGDLLTN